MAEQITAVLVMIVLFITGIAMLFNLPNYIFGINLGIGFSSINGLMSGMWIITLKLVGLILAILSAYIIKEIINH